MNLCNHFIKSVRLYTNFNSGNKLFKSFNFSPLNLTKFSLNPLQICKHELSTSCSLNRCPGITYPRPVSRYWAISKMRDPHQYTVDPLPLVRTGGRGPDGNTFDCINNDILLLDIFSITFLI
ncbi:unnamed protein product [Schistosoma mattheei]|uniref:Uncharacterized protein n=1 Tax=Schistosoma mattheei TaxID=31246 RepID=A0A183NL02_9TREM|nr:unnamed protein product [Schistosoma mattheei]